MKKAVLSLFLLCLFLQATAAIRLPGIIGDHMVLKQNSAVELWGWGAVNEKITVKPSWTTEEYNIAVNPAAKWSVTIPTPAAGGPYTIILQSSNSKKPVVINDVLIGEVWLCSGQSNMAANASSMKQADSASVYANNPQLRFFNLTRTTALYPQENCDGRWVVCNPEDMKRFSAIGYFFGERLQKALDRPVGLIHSAWGGTNIEVWMPRETVEAKPELKAAADKLKSFKTDRFREPGGLFNAMIYPLAPYTLSGVLWYQGESNVKTWEVYTESFTDMIGSWRQLFKAADLPFYYVQIAPYAKNEGETGILLREAQTKALKCPNTGMVVISDLVDDINDIHPQLKVEVAQRLTNMALVNTYGKTGIPCRSPLYKGMAIEKNKIRIFFDHADSGLISKNGAPSEFYIAGADGQFLSAQAKIEGSTVVVWNKTIKQPLNVRFGFSNAAMPNLFSKEGLPADAFRTDK